MSSILIIFIAVILWILPWFYPRDIPPGLTKDEQMPVIPQTPRVWYVSPGGSGPWCSEIVPCHIDTVLERWQMGDLLIIVPDEMPVAMQNDDELADE